MNMKEYLIKKYGDDSNCYPFDGNNKYVFMFVFDEMDDESVENNVVELTGESELSPSEVFQQLMDNDKIDYFCYYADGNKHHIKAYISNEATLMAYKLVDDCNKAFDITIK